MAMEGLPSRLVELVTGGDRALQTGTSDAIARLVMAVPNQVGTGGKPSGPGKTTFLIQRGSADSLLPCHSCCHTLRWHCQCVAPSLGVKSNLYGWAEIA